MKGISEFEINNVGFKKLKLAFAIKFKQTKKDGAMKEFERIIPGNDLIDNPIMTLKKYFPTVFYSITPNQKIELENIVIHALESGKKQELARGWCLGAIKDTFCKNKDVDFECFFQKIPTPKFIKYNSGRMRKIEFRNDILNMIVNLTLDEEQKLVVIPLLAMTLTAAFASAWKKYLTINPDFIVSLTGKNQKELERLALTCCNVYDRVPGLTASAYSDIHVFPEDTLDIIRRKAYLCKDSVLIAFNPTIGQCEFLYELYTRSGSVPGMCLIVAESANKIPFRTLNIDVPDEASFDFLKKNKTNYFIEYLGFYVDIAKKHFARLLSNVNDCYLVESYKKLIRSFLCEPIEVFCDGIGDEKIEDYKTIISELVSDFYPNEDQLSYERKDAIIRICKNFDSYFDKKHIKALVHCGDKSSIATTRAWYDDEHIYVTSEVLDDIQRIFSGAPLTNEDKRDMALCDLIKVNKNHKRTEYVIRVHPAVCDIAEPNQRYFAFKRTSCACFFENINAIINGIPGLKVKRVKKSSQRVKAKRSTVENRMKIITGFYNKKKKNKNKNKKKK